MGRSLAGALFGVLVLMPVSIQAATPAERGQWMANMGESGLRRFYSSGGDLGEMVNRAVSYQTANRVFNQQQNNPVTAPAAQDMRSHADTWVVQSDCLIPVADSVARPLFLRTLVRLAGRDENTRVDSRSGIVRQIARGKRVQLEYQRYQHTRDTRSRNNLSLIAVVDF